MSGPAEPFQPDTLIAKMLRAMMVAGNADPETLEGAVLDIYNDTVKLLPTGIVAGLRALCTAELHERGEDT